jgi:hypothetical protein
LAFPEFPDDRCPQPCHEATHEDSIARRTPCFNVHVFEIKVHSQVIFLSPHQVIRTRGVEDLRPSGREPRFKVHRRARVREVCDAEIRRKKLCPNLSCYVAIVLNATYDPGRYSQRPECWRESMPIHLINVSLPERHRDKAHRPPGRQSRLRI